MKMRSMGKTVVWGDSVARGVIYDERRARYMISKQAAARSVSDAIGTEVVLRAHMGMTAVQGAALMEKDLEKGMVAEAALLGFGGNDSDFDWRAISADPTADHQPKTPLATYEADVREMISMAQGAGMRVTLCTLPPIMSERYFDFFSGEELNRENILAWLGDKNKIYRFHERYSLLLGRLAREYSCRLIDLRAAFLEKWDVRPYYCRDGIHPNAEGQRLLGESILAAI